MSSKFCHPKHRDLLALIVKHDPGARAVVRLMRRLGATNLRPDRMMFRTVGGKVDEAVDPGAWSATVRGDVYVAMIRHGNNDWTLHS